MDILEGYLMVDGFDLEVKMRVGKGGAVRLYEVDQWHCSPRI